MEEKKSLVPVGDGVAEEEARIGEMPAEGMEEPDDGAGEHAASDDGSEKGSDEAAAEEDDSEAEDEGKDEEKKDEGEDGKKEGSKGRMLGVFLVVAAVLMAAGAASWALRDNAAADEPPAYEDAAAVMAERMSPELKAHHFSPTRVYRLTSATDSYHGMSLTVTRIQFRQDVTRLWVRIKNDSGRRISIMPANNSFLTDDNGHTYKAEPFAGDQVTAAAPGSDEEVLLAYEPVRNDAKSLTFTLDGAFDMKNTSWNYAVQFDLPKQ